MSNSLLVGIDVSLNDNKVRVLHPDGTSLLKFSVPNNNPGATTLSQRVAGVMEKNSFDSLVIGLESTCKSLQGLGSTRPKTLLEKKTGSLTTCS